LKVRVAELDRTALRQIGADFLGAVPEFGSVFGTRINSNIIPSSVTAGNKARIIPNVSSVAGLSTAFGVFQGANFEFLLTALRQNSVLKILAEPNLSALTGHQDRS